MNMLYYYKINVRDPLHNMFHSISYSSSHGYEKKKEQTKNQYTKPGSKSAKSTDPDSIGGIR